jgi:hypothetical protein
MNWPTAHQQQPTFATKSANAGHHQDDARVMQLVGGHSLMIFFALR